MILFFISDEGRWLVCTFVMCVFIGKDPTLSLVLVQLIFSSYKLIGLCLADSLVNSRCYGIQLISIPANFQWNVAAFVQITCKTLDFSILDLSDCQLLFLQGQFNTSERDTWKRRCLF